MSQNYRKDVVAFGYNHSEEEEEEEEAKALFQCSLFL